MKEDKIDELQVLRAFGVLAVIAIHVTANFANIKTFNNLQAVITYLSFLFHYSAVPIFTCISGFVLAKRYFQEYDINRYYIKRALSILPQYLLFSMGYIVFTNIQNGFNALSIISVISDLVLGTSYYHLWFFVVIIQLYVLYPLIIKLYIKNKYMLLSLAFIALVGWNVAILLLNITSPSSMKLFMYLELNKKVFFSQLFWFVLGIYISRDYAMWKNKIKKIKLSWLLGVILLGNALIIKNIIIGLSNGYAYSEIPREYFFSNVFLSPFYIVIEILFFLILSIRITEHRAKSYGSFNSIGHYSLGIYLIHPLILNIVTKGLGYFDVDYNTVIFYPVAFVVTLILSYLFVVSISYLPFAKWIIGVERTNSTLSTNKKAYTAS